MRNVEHVCVHVAKSFEVHSGSHLKPQQHCSHTLLLLGRRSRGQEYFSLVIVTRWST